MGKWWMQADCVLIEAPTQQEAFRRYRKEVAAGNIAVSSGRACDAFATMSVESKERRLKQEEHD